MLPPPRIVDVTEQPPGPSARVPPGPSPPGPSVSPPGLPASAPTRPAVRLYVATPCYACSMTMRYLISLVQLQSECVRRGIQMVVDFTGNESLIPRARNVLCARFLKSDFTHLLWIDADIGFAPDAVFRLIDSGLGITSGVYPKKSFDWADTDRKLVAGSKEPVESMGLSYNINMAAAETPVENGFVRVLDTATGFLLIRREVLERMADKYRDTLTAVNDLPGDRSDPMYPTEYVALFDCMIDPVSRRYLSEDYAFSRRAQAMGLDVWADITYPLCHVGTAVFEGDIRERFSLVYAA